MSNPIETERSFRTLQHRLQFPISPRTRLQGICTFLASIEDAMDTNEPYVLELATVVPQIVKDVKFTGTDPETVLGFHKCLSRCAMEILQVGTIPGFKDALEKIAHQAGNIFLWVGEKERATELLVPGLVNWDSFYSSLSRGGGSFHTFLPVVERGSSNGDITGGTLRQISLTLFGVSSAEMDEIHLDVAVFGAEERSEDILKKPLAAARSLLSETSPRLKASFVRAQLRFDEPHALHEGSSANLALAGILYCTFLEAALQRDIYRIEIGTAITGAIDETGIVLPIDHDSIRAKVEAAFYSPIEMLVVPKQQLADSEHAASNLKVKYPGKSLTILGVSHVRELFFDRRITKHGRVSLPKQSLRKIWKWRRPVAAALILALGLMVGGLLYGPLDKTPTSSKLEGEHLVIQNQYDQVLERIPVGRETVYSFTDPSQSLIQHAPAAIADVDGDGIREIVWIENARKHDGFYTVLRCKSINAPLERWTFTPLWKIPFRNNSDVSTLAFRAIQVLVDDFDGDGKMEVLANFRHEAFPNVVVKLDAVTGEELDHYLHIGHFTGMKVHDINGDGVKEILLCGVNNAFREACLVVLDPRDIGGHSPLTKDYEVVGYKRGKEEAYIRIPRTRVGEQYRAVVKSNVCLGLNIHEADSSISLRILDAAISAESPGGPISASIWLKLGYDLSFRGLVTGDDYDIAYDDLVERGKIESLPRSESLRGYKKRLMYLKQEEWESR